MYRRVLVPLDGSATAERGLAEAIALAKGEGAEVLLLHVVDDATPMAEMSASMTAEQLARAREHLERQRERGIEVLANADREATAAGLRVQTVLRDVGQERVGEIVVREAEEGGCDLVVMGTHGRRGFRRLMMGSVAEWVVRATAIPVLLVRHPGAVAAA